MASPQPSFFPSTLPTYPPMEVGMGTADIPVWGYLFQLTIVTALVTVGGYFALKYLRDKVPGLGLQLPGQGRNLRVVDRVTVDATRMVFVVSVGKRYWLLASTGEHVTTVAELDKADAEPVAFTDLVEKESKHL